MRAFLANLVLWLIGHPQVASQTVTALQSAADKLAAKHEAHQGDVATAVEARAAAIAQLVGEQHTLFKLQTPA